MFATVRHQEAEVHGGGPRSRVALLTRTAHPCDTGRNFSTPTAAPPTFRKRSPRRRDVRANVRTLHAHTRTTTYARAYLLSFALKEGREKERGGREKPTVTTSASSPRSPLRAILTRLSRVSRLLRARSTLLLVMYKLPRWTNRRRRLSLSRLAIFPS